MAKERAELLLAHYEATVEAFNRNMKIRGQIGFGMLFVVLVLLFRVQTPDLIEHWVQSWIEKQIVAEESAMATPASEDDQTEVASEPQRPAADRTSSGVEDIDFDFLTTVVWFALSSLLILYLRWSLILERLGEYLRRLEGRLEEAAGGPVASHFRDLRQNRPLFFRVAQHLYSFVMMAMLVGGSLLVLYWEFSQRDASWFRWIDLTIFGLMLLFAGIFSYDVLKTPAIRRRRSGGGAHG